jgi:hypothetical protein
MLWYQEHVYNIKQIFLKVLHTSVVCKHSIVLSQVPTICNSA